MVDFIERNIRGIYERISSAARKSGRDPSEIRLMAVSKTHAIESMISAASIVDIFGENRVQEAVAKKRDWPTEDRVPWHLIGHLQRNKARKALEIFDLIESLDSLDLARMLDRILAETEQSGFPVFIEVNMSGEPTKCGVAPQEAANLMDMVLNYCTRLSIEGIMTIGPNIADETMIRRTFEDARELRDTLRSTSGLPLPELSMGMSGDFEAAVEEGSTIVRIGSGIFGKRSACTE